MKSRAASSDRSLARALCRGAGALAPTGAVILLLEAARRAGLTIPNPLIVAIVAVIYAAFRGGLVAGLANAVLAVLYSMYFFAAPGQFLVYSPENALRIVFNALAVPSAALMVGLLKRRADRLARDLLHAERDYSKAIVDSVWDGIVLRNLAGEILEVNQRFCAMTGFSREELIGRAPPYPHWPKDRYQSNLEALDQSRTGKLGEIDMVFQRKNGERFEVIVNVAPIHGEHRQLSGHVLTVKDATERRLAEAQLIAAENRLRTIIESEPECVKLLARDGTLLEMNAAGLAMIEADSLAQVTGHPVVNLVLPEHRRAFNRLNERIFAGGSGVLEFEIKGLKGTRRWLETHAAPLRNAQGRIDSLLAITRDITERKRAEAVQLERARLAAFHRDIALVFTGCASLQGVLQRCAEVLAQHFDASLARIWTMSADDGALELQAGAGLSTRGDSERFDIHAIARARRPHLTDDVAGDSLIRDHEWARRENVRSFAGYPLIVEDRVVGVMALFCRAPLNDGVTEALSSMAVALAQEISRKQDQGRLQMRNRQQAAIAQLGRRALGPVSLDELFQDTAALVAGVLFVEYAKVLELLPGGGRLLLRAGVGWKDNLVGTATVDAGADSQAGYTLACKVPVIVDDLQADPRFSGPPLLREHGVVSGMSVVIEGDKGAFGVLGAHTAGRRRFNEDDIHFIQAIANILAETVQRRRAADALRRANRMLMILTRSNEALAQARDEAGFLDEVCRIVTEVGDYSLAWIGLAENDAARSVRPVAGAGAERSYLDDLRVGWGDDPRGQGPTGTAIRTREVALSRNIEGDPDFAPWRAQALPRQFVSSIAVPLIDGDRALGALNVYAAAPDAFDAEEIRLLKNLADDVASGIAALREKAKRLQAEETLKEREEHFRALIENGTDLITVIDQAGTALYESPSVERMLGYSATELLNQNLFELVHPDDLASVLAVFSRALQDEGKIHSVEYRVRHKDGTWRDLESAGRSLVHAAPIQGVIINSRDVTDRRRAERLLHESEEKLRQVTDNIKEVFWLTNPEKTEMIYISPGYEEIWGRTCASLYAAPASWLDAIHEEDRARVVSAALTRQAADDYDEEYRILRPDGAVRWIRDRAFPIRDEAGNLYRVAGVAEDITERKQAEEIVRNSEQRLRRVIDGLGPQMFVGLLTPEGNLVEANHPALVATGLELKDVLGKPFAEVYSWSYSEAVQSRLREAIARAARGEPSRYDVELRVADGEAIVVDFTLQPLRDESGKIIFLVASGNVITERKRAEEAQQAAYAELQTLHDISRGVLNTVDLEKTLDLILQKTVQAGGFDLGFVRLLQAGTKEVALAAGRGRAEPAMPLAAPADSGLQRVLETKKTVVLDDLENDRGLGSLRREGARTAVLVPIVAQQQALGIMLLGNRAPRALRPNELRLLEAIGNQAGLAVEKAQLYERVQAHAEQLERANKVKGEFLSVMSHELRTPLNIIMGYTAMIKQYSPGGGDPALIQALQKIETQSRGLLVIIDGIMQATAIESESVNLNVQAVDLSVLLADLRSLDGAARDKGLELIWHLPPTLPQVFTDGEKLRQILHNLIDNAIKFTESGTITISARLAEEREADVVSREEKRIAPTQRDRNEHRDTSEQRDTNNEIRGTHFIEFTVADTGIGIAAERIPVIFELFRQADSSSTREYEGLGLGLYVAKKYSELLGGTLQVESAPGQGCRFTVHIPIGRVQREYVSPAAERLT